MAALSGHTVINRKRPPPSRAEVDSTISPAGSSSPRSTCKVRYQGSLAPRQHGAGRGLLLIGARAEFGQGDGSLRGGPGVQQTQAEQQRNMAASADNMQIHLTVRLHSPADTWDCASVLRNSFNIDHKA